MKKTLFLKLLLLCFYAGHTQEAEVQNMIEFTTAPVAQSDVNRSHTIQFRYTLAQNGIVKVSLSKYHRTGVPMLAVAQFIINPASATTEIPVQNSAELFIPQGTPPSSQLINDQYYQWDAMIMSSESSTVISVTSPVTIGSALGLDSFNLKKTVIYPNPVSEQLFLSHDKNLPYLVTDETGRVVLSGQNSGTIDVTVLKTGLYFLRFNEEILKFIKQ